MKKKSSLSIKARITLWYAVILMTICILVLIAIAVFSNYVVDRYSADTLRSAAIVLMDEMEVEHGLLEIDSDLEDVPNVYASLFSENGDLVYGRRRVNLPFEHGAIREAQWAGHSWYVYDILLEIEEIEPTWLRVHMSSDTAADVYPVLARYGIWLLPLLGLLALLGGYLITAGAFRPVKEMTETAASIADGRDLTRRIDVPDEQREDELHALAVTINAMLDRLQQSFEHECQFTSDAAHELRTPLNAMHVQAEYALSREDVDEKNEAIADLLTKSEEMQALIGHLLMITRMDAGQIPMEDEFDLKDVIEGVAEDLEPVAAEKEIRMETVLESCRMRGSRAMLRRAMVNLTDNAIRYGKEGGRVSILLRCESNRAIAAVEDDGIGISEEDAAHVFDRFWQADRAHTACGAGIGLSIVRAAAQMHGGSVCVQSKPGQGSRFELILPLKKEQKNI